MNLIQISPDNINGLSNFIRDTNLNLDVLNKRFIESITEPDISLYRVGTFWLQPQSSELRQKLRNPEDGKYVWSLISESNNYIIDGGTY